jgi:hypothetical protein
MKILRYVSNLLGTDRIQRLIYLAVLLFWAFIWAESINFLDEYTDFGVKFLWVFITIAILLIIQILFNKKSTWLLFFGITCFIIAKFFKSLIEFFIIDAYKHREYINSISWKSTEELELFFQGLMALLIVWFFWNIRPRKNAL